jgi:hypothetical protein
MAGRTKLARVASSKRIRQSMLSLRRKLVGEQLEERFALTGQHTYTSLPLPQPDNRPDDQIAADAARAAFLATLSSFGTETLDGYPDGFYGSTPTQALTFGATGITAVATYSGAFKLPPLPSPVSAPAALVDQPASPGNPPYGNDMTFSSPVTAFGSYFIQAGDVAADTFTLKLENTDLGTSKNVVMGTIGPNANFNNVFYFGVTDTDPFNRVTLLSSNLGDGVLLDNITVGTVAPEPSTVAGRFLFYNQSGTATRYDGNNLAINSLDDNAIATDKTAYTWESTVAATFANVSSYTKGINGIMVDISGPHGTITTSDFIFRVGNNNSPGTWATIGATSVSVRAGAGTGGSDRVEIIWTSGAATKQWLEVITLANANTGLPQLAGYPVGQGDAFFFGNALGDSGLGDTAINATVNATDENGARNNPATLAANIPITNIYDYDRNAQVNANDQNTARNNATNTSTVLKFINLTTAPAAPEAASADEGDGGEISPLVATSDSGDGGVASALTAPTPSLGGGVPKWVSNRLQNLDLNSGGAARFFQHLHDVNTPGSRSLLQKLDAAADALGLDDELLDELLADLK